MEKFFSIIVPVYNVANYLQTCVDSLLNQSCNDMEIILVDDGSTDNSPLICDDYANSYGIVRVIHQPNKGVSIARNCGIAMSNGKYIVFIDSDDWVDKDFFKVMRQYLHEKPVDLLISKYMVFKNNHIIPLEVGISGQVISVDDIADHFENMFKAGLINSPYAKCYRRECISARFDPNISLGEDLIFNLTFLHGCKTIRYIDQSLYFYRVVDQSNSLSTKFREDGLQLAYDLFVRTNSLCMQLWGDIRLESIERRFVDNVVANCEKIIVSNSQPFKARIELIRRFWTDKHIMIYYNNHECFSTKQRIYIWLIDNGYFNIFHMCVFMAKYVKKVIILVHKHSSNSEFEG